MKLAVLPEQGGSLESLRRSGQDQRFVRQYLGRYAQAFEHVYYFSYAPESASLPTGCELVPNARRLHRWVYAVLMPFLHARRFRDCDVMRVMQLTGEVPAVLAKLLHRVPFAATYGYRYSEHARADGEGRLRSALFGLRTRLALRFADRVIVTNPAIRAEVAARLGENRVVLLPNGVDVRVFAPREVRAEGDTPTLLYVGRLSPQKNLPLLIEAASRLGRAVRIRLVGGGALERELAALADRLGVCIEFGGVVPHDRLPDELTRAAVFAITSHVEGHPKALLEAMSCGCVCVATAAPGVVDVITHEHNGLLCAADAPALAGALARALDDGELRQRLSVNARLYVEKNYNLEAILLREIAMLRALAEEAA